jgi:cell division protein FtsI/penicillin-binding protein 2
MPADDREEDLSGSGVILTLDATIQEFARDELMVQFKDFQAESAIAVVADPKTGAILALVSLPDFHPAESGTADPNTLCNHAVIDQFEPGSVLKPVLAAIALDAGVINTAEKIDCENGVYRGKGFGTITEYNDHHYGLMTVREILAKSSNVGMAKIGQRMGAALQYSGLRLFGFSKTTGLGLPGEAEGTLWPPGRWTGYSVTRVPYGQEVSVTAIQLVKAFCILANHGRLVRPHLVKAVVDASGQPDIRAYSLALASQVGYVVRPEVADWVVKTAMVAVINDEEGTGKSAKLEKWQVFGKTGTAQVARADGRGYEEGAHIASFVGGAPVEDPTIVVFVSIRRPNERLHRYSGGVVAAPVVGRILDRTLTYLESRGYVFTRHDSARLVKAR